MSGALSAAHNFLERNVSGAHVKNYERKKSGAHVFLEERAMSAKLSDERKKSAENKFIISANLKKQFFTFSVFHCCVFTVSN